MPLVISMGFGNNTYVTKMGTVIWKESIIVDIQNNEINNSNIVTPIKTKLN